MATAVRDLLDKAKTAIRSSDARLRDAANYIAAAKTQGATQDRVAKHLGRSPAWVSLLLCWRRGGFKGTPFGPQSRAARQAVKDRVQLYAREDREAAATTTPRQPSVIQT